MSFHFCSHAWEVRDLEDGTSVTLANRDLAQENLACFVEDLCNIVRESGRPNLYLDFDRVGLIDTSTLGLFPELHRQIQESGGKLALVDLNRPLYEMFETAGLTSILDVRPRDAVLAY
jgi:anti-anti-sigma factor